MRNQVYYIAHLEIGYTSNSGRHIPNPEYSGPANRRALSELEKQIAPGVMEEALRKAIDILDQRHKKGLFLAFPCYAENHGARELRKALKRGHMVGAHLHEDWKKLVSSLGPGDLTSYFRTEKGRIERAVGVKINVFSYGPGIQLDDMGGREAPPKSGSLTDNEKIKLFNAVSRAGFTFIQAPREYARFLPSDLRPIEELGISLESIGHSYEWHDERGVIKEFVEKLENLK